MKFIGLKALTLFIFVIKLSVAAYDDFEFDPQYTAFTSSDVDTSRISAQIYVSDVEIESETVQNENNSKCLHPPTNNHSLFNVNDNQTVNDCIEENVLEHAPQFQPSTLARVVILSIIAVLSLIGNIATLVSICRTKRQNSSTVYLLIAQLAIADLLVTLFCVLAEAIWTFTVQWYGGNFLCKLVKYIQMFALYLSTFILVVIGFDRFCAVRFPMKRAHAKHHVRRGVVAVWILSAVLSLPQLAIFRIMKGPFIEEFYQCVTYGFYTAAWQEQLYTTISLILMFLLPLIILITTYICTFYTISRSGKENMFCERLVRTPLDDARRKIIHKAKVKSLMITVVIVLAFVICWTPYYVMMIIFIFLDPDKQLSEELQSAIFFFGSSTAMINPIIYGAFHLRRGSSRKSTLLNNSSASSRVENSVMMMNFRKSRSHIHQRSRDEAGIISPLVTLPNGQSCNGLASTVVSPTLYTSRSGDHMAVRFAQKTK